MSIETQQWDQKKHTAAMEDRTMQRLRALAVVFTKTNRILASDKRITVNMLDKYKVQEMANEHGGNIAKAPGFTLYPDIYINTLRFGNFSEKRTLVQLLGLNYHELSHVLFSPRNLTGQLNAQEFEAYNILEDQRIESLFTALYQPAGKYFTEMVVKFMVQNPKAWDCAFLFTHGRSFLPLEIREEFEQRFIGDTRTRNKAKKLIEEYKSFSSSDIALYGNLMPNVRKCILDFAALLKRLREKGADVPDDQGCGGGDPKQGRPDTTTEEEAKDEEKKQRDKEEETGEDQSGFWEDEDESDEDDQEEADDHGDSESGDEEGEGSESEEDGDDESSSDSGDGSDDDSGEPSDDDGDGEDSDSDEDSSGGGEGDSDTDSDGEPEDEANEEGDSDDSENAGDGGGESGDSEGTTDFSDDELKEYLQDIAEAVQQDQDVEDEVTRIQNSMNDRSNLDFLDFGKESFNMEPVEPAETNVLRTIQKDFRKLYADVDPGWVRGSDQGRLNVGRAILDPDAFDTHFDEWDEGKEQETGMEVFIALDMSGSMQSDPARYGPLRHDPNYVRIPAIKSASRVLWIIKRALDEVGAKTTVVGFHSSTVGLYSRDEAAPRGEWPVWTDLGGSTEPDDAFKMARAVLNGSDIPNKLFIIITDGGWQNRFGLGEEDHASLVELIPGTKMYVGIGPGAGSNLEARKKFDTTLDMTHDPDSLVSLVDKTVQHMIASAKTRH